MKRWIVALYALLTACAGVTEPEEECMRIDLSTTFDKQPEKVVLDQWASSVRFIPLETNDSILIPYISRIVKHGDKLLVQHENRASVFNLDGKYLYDIGRQGGGPDEFSRLSELVPHDDLIYIKEGGNQIKVYGWDGRYIRSKMIPGRGIRSIYPLPGSDLIVGHVPNFSGSIQNRFYFFRDTTLLDSIPNHKTYREPLFVMVFTNEFRPFDGNRTTAFKELFCDTVFKVNKENKLLPYTILDLGKYHTPEDLRYNLTMDQAMNSPFSDKIVPILSGEVGDKIYMHNFSDKIAYTLCYDKVHKKVSYLELVYPDNSYEFPEKSVFSPRFISDDNQYLINWEQPENDSNPVVILVKP